MIRVEAINMGSSGVVELVSLEAGRYSIKCAGAKGGAGNGDKSIQSCLGGFGAILEGILTLDKPTNVVVLPGNPGTDHPRTSGDGTTGAGGGGTYVAMVVDSNTPNALQLSGFSNSDINGLYVLPLMVAAGGNGGRDYGYSGDGTTYHGSHEMRSAFVSGTNQGGSFANNTLMGTSNGSNFIAGGAGATHVYNRNGSSTAGFGGGGSNRDDGEGGGGGGYYGGHTSLSASSYWDSNYITDLTGTTGGNNGFGYVEFEILMPSGPFKLNGEFEVDISFLSDIDNLDYIILKDDRFEPTNTSIDSYISINDGNWVEINSEANFRIRNVKSAKLKYILASTDELVSPSIRGMSIIAVEKINNKQVIIKINPNSNFNNVNGELTIVYNNESGLLKGRSGDIVPSFTSKFTPSNLNPKPNPHITEYVNVEMKIGNTYATHVFDTVPTIDNEYTRCSLSIASVVVN